MESRDPMRCSRATRVGYDSDLKMAMTFASNLCSGVNHRMGARYPRAI